MIARIMKNRLKEASTWKALLTLLTLFGLSLTDAQSEAVATAGVAVYAALSALLPDRLGSQTEAKKSEEP